MRSRPISTRSGSRASSWWTTPPATTRCHAFGRRLPTPNGADGSRSSTLAVTAASAAASTSASPARSRCDPDLRYLYILNPDAVIEPGALLALVGFMDVHPDAGMLGNEVRNRGADVTRGFRFPTIWSELEGAASFGPLSRLLRKYTVPVNPGGSAVVDWVSGVSMLVRREVLLGCRVLRRGLLPLLRGDRSGEAAAGRGLSDLLRGGRGGPPRGRALDRIQGRDPANAGILVRFAAPLLRQAPRPPLRRRLRRCPPLRPRALQGQDRARPPAAQRATLLRARPPPIRRRQRPQAGARAKNVIKYCKLTIL